MGLWNELFSLSGDTVRLEPLEKNHEKELWAASRKKEIWTYMATQISSQEKLSAEIMKALEERKHGRQYPFVVILKERNEIVGCTRFLDLSPDNKSAEIGFTWFSPSVWGTKVNTECKFLMLTHAFENWQLNRIFFKTDSRNIRSQNAIARIGAVKEGVLRKDRIISDGYVRDTVYYSILKEEWPNVKKELIIKLERK
ncbi:RimJ/RimL family protein N-acetyltransferase [Cytobacillus eiseniae]|uniref:RimJ/RimL family protein N-acetyltransferase n=1 Tax=Cytobacillus eiseniae TaxID=762947 RepID=A0ABS4RA25_9BACI|nr:GNAT family protein [Cytobacillus eiseniae]MBP2239742.1 RimJ/RimL family protein N-acetyltransferase [Cytobacillus eiseniae]